MPWQPQGVQFLLVLGDWLGHTEFSFFNGWALYQKRWKRHPGMADCLEILASSPKTLWVLGRKGVKHPGF